MASKSQVIVSAMCPYCNMRFSQMADGVEAAIMQLGKTRCSQSYDNMHTFADINLKVGVIKIEE